MEDLNQPNHKLRKHRLRSKTKLVQLLDKIVINHEGSFKSDSQKANHFEGDTPTQNTDSDENYTGKGLHSIFSEEMQEEPFELSLMASMKQIKGNSGTLFTLMHYSQSDGSYHR